MKYCIFDERLFISIKIIVIYCCKHIMILKNKDGKVWRYGLEYATSSFINVLALCTKAKRQVKTHFPNQTSAISKRTLF